MKFSSIILILCISVSLFSCSASRDVSSSDGWAYNESSKRGGFELSEDIDKLEALEEETQNSETNKTTRKLIYTSTLGFEVDSTHTARAKVMKIAEKYNGYMVSSSNASISIRVPAKDRVNAIKDIKTVGELYTENHTGQDVTDAYFDIQLRLDNAEKARKRYLELLEQAQTVDEVLKVEKELERLNEKIELYKGKIKHYNNQIDYSLINVRFKLEEETVKPGPIGYIFVGLYKGVKWLFVRGGKN